jgi:aminoglycoside phosphotransferase (APT) family kinase protein
MLSQQQCDLFAGHLRAALPAQDVRITHMHRFHGGASRETYSVDVEVDGRALGLVLRMDPAESLITTPRALEFAAFRSCEGSGLPVPLAISLVTDGAMLGTPFFVMERIDGGAAVSPFDPSAYGDHRAAIGAQFFDYLGQIHRIDALISPLAQEVETPATDACWHRELDHWAGLIAKDQLEPEPIAEAAIRWLRRNPPPPAKRLTIVHGDYRNGNVLHDGSGRIIALLDWEMAHIGDPLEDLAWALDPLWTIGRPDLAAGLIPRAEAIARWEAASGCTFDEKAFAWWEVFAMLKGVSIWISSARAYANAVNTDPVLAFSGWFTKILANRSLVTRIAPAGILT